MAVDPYPQIKAVIEKELEQLYDLQKDVFAGRPNAIQHALDAVRSVEEQLEALEQAVALMVGDPGRFGLSSSSAYHRQVEVEDLRFQLQEVKSSLEGVETAELQQNGYAKLPTSTPSTYPKDTAPGSDQRPGGKQRGGHSEFEQHSAQVQMIIRQQDEELDGMSRHIDVLKDQSYRVFEELGEQEVLLGHLDQDLDMTRWKLRGMTKRVQEVIKKNGGCKTLTIIIVLLVILLILFVLALN